MFYVVAMSFKLVSLSFKFLLRYKIHTVKRVKYTNLRYTAQ